ncbi:hypothetical protein [Mesomycoplasma bovoculi]|uniref:Uncharacterized protein n=1 Tax=Mesomycoplasma bovoculi M165/69 TaxID=743966 RepID=W5UTB7_9BACT|nr:hypothetical protein [Mesomycoplasma bovoculi]AHH45060.1 hypothetical protein MYB_00240 [Mesomycoplasma bovoculi M165/69]
MARKKILTSLSLMAGVASASAIAIPVSLSQNKITANAVNQETIPLYYDWSNPKKQIQQSATIYTGMGKFNVKLEGVQDIHYESIFRWDYMYWKGYATSQFDPLNDDQNSGNRINSQVIAWTYGWGYPQFSTDKDIDNSKEPGYNGSSIQQNGNELISTVFFNNVFDTEQKYGGKSTMYKIHDYGQRHRATLQSKQWFIILDSDSKVYSDSRPLTQFEKYVKEGADAKRQAGLLQEQIEQNKKEQQQAKEDDEKLMAAQKAKEEQQRKEKEQKEKEEREHQEQIELIKKEGERKKLELEKEIKKLEEQLSKPKNKHKKQNKSEQKKRKLTKNHKKRNKVIKNQINKEKN